MPVIDPPPRFARLQSNPFEEMRNGQSQRRLSQRQETPPMPQQARPSDEVDAALRGMIDTPMSSSPSPQRPVTPPATTATTATTADKQATTEKLSATAARELLERNMFKRIGSSARNSPGNRVEKNNNRKIDDVQTAVSTPGKKRRREDDDDEGGRRVRPRANNGQEQNTNTAEATRGREGRPPHTGLWSNDRYNHVISATARRRARSPVISPSHPVHITPDTSQNSQLQPQQQDAQPEVQPQPQQAPLQQAPLQQARPQNHPSVPPRPEVSEEEEQEEQRQQQQQHQQQQQQEEMQIQDEEDDVVVPPNNPRLLNDQDDKSLILLIAFTLPPKPLLLQKHPVLRKLRSDCKLKIANNTRTAFRYLRKKPTGIIITDRDIGLLTKRTYSSLYDALVEAVYDGTSQLLITWVYERPMIPFAIQNLNLFIEKWGLKWEANFPAERVFGFNSGRFEHAGLFTEDIKEMKKRDFVRGLKEVKGHERVFSARDGGRDGGVVTAAAGTECGDQGGRFWYVGWEGLDEVDMQEVVCAMLGVA